MNRISTTLLGALMAFGGTSAGAADVSPQNPLGEGSIYTGLVDDGTRSRLGLKVFGFLQVGASANDVTTHDQATRGHSNFPVVGPTDEGLQLNALQLFVERPMVANLMPRITPLPGHAPSAVSWGFWVEALYGRNGVLASMAGLDADWGINRTPAGTVPGTTRQSHLAVPQAYLQLYLPLGRGVALTAGRFGAGVGYEIPPALRLERSALYSKSYAFIAQPDQVAGVMASANLLPASGPLLLAELGVVQGRQNWRDNNADKSLIGALRWRSADMATWIDYSLMSGNEQNDPDVSPQMPIARIISPRGQRRDHHSLSVVVNPSAALQIQAEALVGRQRGDGRPDTIDILTGPGFRGGRYSGLNAQALLRASPTLRYALRAEHFRNRDGIALFPATAASGDFVALTLGAQIDLNRHLVLRPEIRHDQQSRAGALKAFGEGTATRQTTLSVDAVIYF